MTELLRCPFCGDAGRIEDDEGRFYVTCLGLDCFVCVGEAYDSYYDPAHMFYTEEAAAEAWNRRPTDHQ